MKNKWIRAAHRKAATRARLFEHKGERPRLSVHRSLKYIYAQVIDDGAGRTLAQASDLEVGLRDGGGTKTERARKVGALLAQRAKQAGLEAVVFDRGGFEYAGRVQALADAAREEGLVF